ncbi:MAG: lysylphosphatidylglycerol synthase domain-containing protein [Nonlabens sp.]
MIAIPHKAKQILIPALKIIVILACVVTLYLQWQDQPPSWEEMAARLSSIHWIVVPAMLLISLSSWMIESKKWQVLVRDVYVIRFRESVFQNLTAQAASFITPFKTGEFVAKALYFRKTYRKQITQRVFIGNYCQMLITTILGVAALLFSRFFYLELIYVLLIVTALIVVTVFAIYLWISKRLGLDSLPNALWLQTFLLSLFRYMVFATNWIIVLHAMNYDATLVEMMVAVSTTYFAISLLPLVQVLDMPARILVATTFFSGSSNPIILAVTIVWFTNTVFPTLLGCLLIPFRSGLSYKSA